MSKFFKCNQSILSLLRGMNQRESQVLELASLDQTQEAQKTITSYAVRLGIKVRIQGFKCVGMQSDELIKILKVTII